jgi:hypothetical protein
MAVWIPLVGPVCQDDINLMAGCLTFTHYLARYLYNARIWTVMARSIWDLGYGRLWLGGEL